MKNLKPIVAFSVILLLAAGLFAQDAAVSFRTGNPPATWCPILDQNLDPLAAGSYIGLYITVDPTVNPPSSDPATCGEPTGDDVRAENNTIGNGMDHLEMGFGEFPFVPPGNMFTGNGAVAIPPAATGTEPVWNQGDTGYLRAFNHTHYSTATHYNDVLTVNGTPQNTMMYAAAGPVTTVVCFTDAMPLNCGPAACIPQEAAGPEGPVVIAPGMTHYFFGETEESHCTLWITAGTGTLTVTATLYDMEPPCKSFPMTTYMTRYYELEGVPESFFDIYFGYSQPDYDASDFGADESLLHVAWFDGTVGPPCTGLWRKVLPTIVTDTDTLGGYCQVTVDHFSLWSFGWDGGETQLPVELTSFVATAGDRMVKLDWVTASETDNAGFYIERSVDGENFVRVNNTIIEGTNSATGGEYTYEDTQVSNGVHYTYRLVDVDINGIETISVITTEATPSFLAGPAVVTEYKLHQNYPNPFNPATSIVYDVLDEGRVTLKVYNVMGQEVATLVNANRENGRYAATFDATGLSSGIYFYTVKVNNFTDTKKMLLVQ